MGEVIRGEGVPISEAARLMGVTEHAIRKAIQRNTVQSYVEKGRRMVLVPSDKVLVTATELIPVDEQGNLPTQSYERLIAPWIAQVKQLQAQLLARERENGELQAELREARRKYRAALEMVEEYKQQRDEAKKQASEPRGDSNSHLPPSGGCHTD